MSPSAIATALWRAGICTQEQGQKLFRELRREERKQAARPPRPPRPPRRRG